MTNITALTDVTTATASARRVSLQRLLPSAPVQATLAPETLTDIAVGLARAEGLWRRHVCHDPLSRTAVRLVETDSYEVWLLGWTTGQQVDLHDHGGANAAFVVLAGELDEITLGFAGSTTKRLRTGGVSTVPAGTVHDVVHAGDAPATSLHVYSDPLRTMTFFDQHGIAQHTELVEQVPAIISSTPVARSLHPARGGR